MTGTAFIPVGTPAQGSMSWTVLVVVVLIFGAIALAVRWARHRDGKR